MFRSRRLCLVSRKGMGLIFPNQDVDIWYGNVREFGDAGGSLGKRCLFFLTVAYPEIRLSGDRVNWRVKHLVFRGVRCALNRP
jgi:hypothetical protein